MKDIASSFETALPVHRAPPKRRYPTGARTKAAAGLVEVSEDLLAQRFTHDFGGELLFDHDISKWFRWNGVHWEMERTALAFEYARRIARTHGLGERALGRAGTATGVERFARADRAHAVTSDIWDMDPLLLGTPNGTVDLRTGSMRAPQQQDRITKQAGAAPAAGEPERWLRFLREALAGDEDFIRFLQLWSGYCLTGLTSAHALLFIYGPGGNGKSVFLNTLLRLLGSYSTVATMDTFIASRNDRHSTELAMLKGARLVTASETEEGRAWAEARIKSLTGGDPITARFMRQDNFTFRPQFKLTIVGNHQPSLSNVDDAMRRRFNIAPFVLKPSTVDKHLEDKIAQELPQIMAWAVRGAQDYLAHGLSRPKAIVTWTEEYFADQDLFGQWFGEHCECAPGRWATVADFFADWSRFAKAAGEDPGTGKSFGSLMKKKGFRSKSKRPAGLVCKVYEGVGLSLSDHPSRASRTDHDDRGFCDD